MRLKYSSLAPVVCALFVGFACSSEADRIGESFKTTTALMTELHQAAFRDGFPAPTNPWSFPCDSGSIDMTTTATVFEGGVDLLHVFKSCAREGLTMDGPLDYLGVTECAGGFRITLRGNVTYSGSLETACPIEVEESCSGKFTGTACGFDIAETGVNED